MVLSPTFVTFQVINAFISLGHKGLMSMIEPSKITIEIRENIPFDLYLMFIILVPNILSLFPLFKRERKT
jgi:hypothetical protein